MQTLPTTLSADVPVKDARTWAMIAHLSAFAGHVFPLAHIIAPLAVWLVKRETSAFVDDQGKEAVNAQISVTLYTFIGIPLCVLVIGIPLLLCLAAAGLNVFVIPAIPICGGLIGLPLFAGLYIANFILVIVAAVAANEGRAYRYPYILRFVR